MTEPPFPPHREVVLRILTLAGWVEGRMRLQGKMPLSDYFERDQELTPLTDVKLEGKVDRLGSLALRRSSVLLILAGEHEPHDPSKTIASTEQRIECLLANGFVSGRMQVMKGVRVSDHLARHLGSFAVLRDARIRLRDPWSNEQIDLLEPAVILNLQAIVGLVEPIDAEKHAASAHASS